MRIAPKQRERWLRELAAKLDPPGPRARTPAAARQVRVRQRRKNGLHRCQLWLSGRAIEGLMNQLLATGRLSEQDALDFRRFEIEFARLAEEQGSMPRKVSSDVRHSRQMRPLLS